MTPDKIRAITPSVLAITACVVGVISLFTPYGKERLGVAIAGLSGAAGLSQIARSDSSDK